MPLRTSATSRNTPNCLRRLFHTSFIPRKKMGAQPPCWKGFSQNAAGHAEEKRLAELLTFLIEDFEEKHYALLPAEPLEILRHLMDANGLRQMDLLDVFGT